MFRRALNANEKERGLKHIFTLKLVSHLDDLYAKQGKRSKIKNKLIEAESMYQRVLNEGQGPNKFNWNPINIPKMIKKIKNLYVK